LTALRAIAYQGPIVKGVSEFPRSPIPHTAFAKVAWPALPTGFAAQLLALLQQMEQSQWWPPERHERLQFRQLGQLLAHAFAWLPFHRDRLAAAGYRPGLEVTPELWSRVPVIARREMQSLGDALISPQLPKEHGAIIMDSTSGSTGVPLRIAKSGHVQTIWAAITLREVLWHRRDIRLKLGALKRDPEGRSFAPAGRAHPDWSVPFATVFPTGPAALLDSRSTTAEQAAWLLREQPAYFIAFPTLVRDVARYFLERGLSLPSLKGVNTRGEPVDPELRELCRRAFGAEVADMYSANEVGYVALQCPEAEHFHVQSESALVEVLDERGRPCAPGEVGIVVVTPLHNFAMPMLRYALGDLAEVGAPCACGRGLPVLKRILGRARDTLALPSGSRRYARIDMKSLQQVPGIVQFQVVQKTLHDIEMKLVTSRPLGPEDEEKIRAEVKKSLGDHLSVVFTYHDEIPRAASGKYFDFMSEIPA